MKSGYIIGLLIFLMVAVQPLAACECDSTKQTSELIEEADLVFEGKVNFVKTNWMSGGWKFSFEVTRTWKKPTANFLIINTKWERDCGYIFEEGKTYLVYTDKTFGLKTNACMGNKLLSEAGADLELLGESMAPEPHKQSSFMGITLILLTLGSMIFLAFVVLRKRKN